MRLVLIEANASRASQLRLYERAAANDKGDVKHVFLTPDRFTVSVERDLCKYCFDGAYTNADVASFTRYAVKTVGRKINKCLSKEGTVILLSKVMSENADKLAYYRNLSGYGFAKELFAAIASLRSAGIKPEDIEIAVEGKEGVIYDKLRDVALISKEYDKKLKDRFTDTVTRIDELISYVNKTDLSDTFYYVLGFNIFSEQQLSLIKSLAKNAREVVVSMVKNAEFTSFQGRILEEFCTDNGIEFVRDELFEDITSPFKDIAANLFKGEKGTIKAEDVILYREESPTEEILAAAREIRYLTQKEGYRFRDIAALVNNPDYLPEIREIFARCGVPLFIDEGYAVTDGAVYRYIDYLFSAALKGDGEDYYKLALHPFSGIGRDDAEEFRLYCKKYNIKYRKFQEKFLHGDGRAEKVREKLVEAVKKIPKSAAAGEYCDLIGEILAEEGTANILKKYSESSDIRLIAASDPDPILKLAEETKTLMGEKPLSASEFFELFRAATADMKVVLRPDYYDAVFVGNSEESRYSDIKILFVLGATDGFFPIKSGDGLIFTAMDNENMRRMGLNVFPSPVEKNRLEGLVTLDILSKPEKIYLGCPDTDLSGEEVSPGDYYSETAFLMGVTPPNLVDCRDFTEEERLNYLLATPENAYNLYVSGRVEPQYRAAVGKMLEESGLLKESGKTEEISYPTDGVFRSSDGVFETSVSQLESYFACPFMHLMRYGLRAQEEDDFSLKPNDLGKAIHNVLEHFFRDNLERVYLDEDLSAEMLQAVENEFKKREYDRYYEDPVSNHILNEVKKECFVIIPALRENMRRSKFRPVGFEVEFGQPDDEFALTIVANSNTFRLRGKIDRADEKDGEIIIIDYKSGSVDSDLKDVYGGKKIQLYAYLAYCVKRGKKPAGVFYLPIRSGNYASGRSYAFKGQMKKSLQTLIDIDDRVAEAEDTYESPTAAFKVSFKKGELCLNPNKNLLTEMEFYGLIDYVEELIKQALTEITEGYCGKKPLAGKCDYCPYNSMCGTPPSRTIPAVKISDFPTIKEGE